MVNKENKSDPNTWSKLYSAENSRQQDTWRTISFVLVFIIAMVIMLGYLAIYTSIYPNQISNQGGLGFTGFFVVLIKNLGGYIIVLMITISVGLGLVFYSIRLFFRAFYKPNDSVKLLKQIITRLFGLPSPPLPPPFSKTKIGRYPFVLVNIDDVVAKKFILKNHPCYWLGGPALLIVFDGTGIYLQRGNCFSRTLGPGIHFLERFETVRDIVDLRLQTIRSSTDKDTPPPVAGRTKDGIKIKLYIEISFRVIPASTMSTEKENGRKTVIEKDVEEKFLKKSPIYSGDLEAIRKAVERTSVRKRPDKEYSEAKMSDAVWGYVSGELAKYITKHSLDDLLVFEGRDDSWSRAHQVGVNSNMNTGFGNTINSKAGQLLSEQERVKIRQHLDKSLRNSTGVTLTDLRILDVDLPPEVNKQRQKMIEVETLSRKKLIKGNAEADQILIREKAHTQTLQNLIAILADSLSEIDPDIFADAVMLSLSNVLSQKTEDTINSTLFTNDTFGILDQLRKFLSQEE